MGTFLQAEQSRKVAINQLKDLNDFCKAAIIEYNFAKLFFCRETCLIAFAWDRLIHKGNITIECKSLHQEDPEAIFNNIQVPKAESTRIEVHMMTFEMYPRPENEIDMVILVNADPKVWFAPAMLINYIFKQVIRYNPRLLDI